jgi:hypothetical protein
LGTEGARGAEQQVEVGIVEHGALPECGIPGLGRGRRGPAV